MEQVTCPPTNFAPFAVQGGSTSTYECECPVFAWIACYLTTVCISILLAHTRA
ncbi:hypothetical protein BOTBODRAFT_136039, partial [Botryobasidium botryosum FD-172 SS1]